MSEEIPGNRAWFQDWAEEYDATLGKVSRHHMMLDLAVQSSGVRDGDEVLDIGCGTGLLSLKFLAAADCRITAIDTSAEMLALFREKVERFGLTDRVRFRQASAEEMDVGPKRFDIVAATVSLHHVREKAPVIGSIHDSLKDGGRFVLGDIDLDTTGEHEDPERLSRILGYLTSELVLALREGGVQAFERMYDNGKKHILNDGEYCVAMRRWEELCRDAGFREIVVHPVPGNDFFKVLVATK
ncbi:Ubiquinone/menaquinone biosynthesis C-methyltransferase UbiE [anaerobic digester metagenome]